MNYETCLIMKKADLSQLSLDIHSGFFYKARWRGRGGYPTMFLHLALLLLLTL